MPSNTVLPSICSGAYNRKALLKFSQLFSCVKNMLEFRHNSSTTHSSKPLA